MNVEQYREDKDNINFVEQFKLNYPEYFEYINSIQKKFYNFDSQEMTMGCSYAVYSNLVQSILGNKPKHIVEYGPGFSTLLMLRVFEDLDYTPVLTSYENDPVFYKMLVDNGFDVNNVINLVDMEIEDVDDTYQCTYIHDLERHKDVDFIFIDGPGVVVVNGIRKQNINLNLKEFSKYLGGKRIPYLIDGRKRTHKFYREYFGKS